MQLESISSCSLELCLRTQPPGGAPSVCYKYTQESWQHMCRMQCNVCSVQNAMQALKTHSHTLSQLDLAGNSSLQHRRSTETRRSV
jgi:hypothetical protein